VEVLLMSDYNKNNRRKKRNRSEKIGFYTALTICLIAVCMAVYSTYNTVSTDDISAKDITATLPTEAKPVNEVVTGVQETVTIPEISDDVPTIDTEGSDITQSVTEGTSEEKSEIDEKTALETMLSTDLSLTFPLNSKNILRDYNENSVYFKTLNVWKPHTGVDFNGELGEDVFAMCDGAVTKVYDDTMYGKSVEISINDAVCIYSGLGSVNVSEGDSISSGDKIGTIGCVPFEANDPSHIHVSIKINGKYADPLSFVENNQ
jgi:murein DD-endopeptidase MepM/ murein hydrolase activator NlpD